MAYTQDLELGMSAVSIGQVYLNKQHQNYKNKSQI